MTLIKSAIKVLDILYWVNVTFKAREDRIANKEFHNDAVNTSIDLREPMIDWAARTYE